MGLRLDVARRDAEIRASSEAGSVLAARLGISASRISRIRATKPVPLTNRNRFQMEVIEGGWTAACMDPDEWQHWLASNPISVDGGDAHFAVRPCHDCPATFSQEMRALGRCNGIPGTNDAAVAAPAIEEEAMTTEEQPQPEPVAANVAAQPDVERPRKRLGPAPGFKRSPETRERMRQGQLARYAGIRTQLDAADATGTNPAFALAESQRTPPLEEPVSPSSDAAPVTALPCGPCAHFAVCSIRPELEMALPTFDVARPHPAIHLEVRCDHFLEVVA